MDEEWPFLRYLCAAEWHRALAVSGEPERMAFNEYSRLHRRAFSRFLRQFTSCGRTLRCALDLYDKEAGAVHVLRARKRLQEVLCGACGAQNCARCARAQLIFERTRTRLNVARPFLYFVQKAVEGSFNLGDAVCATVA